MICFAYIICIMVTDDLAMQGSSRNIESSAVRDNGALLGISWAFLRTKAEI